VLTTDVGDGGWRGRPPGEVSSCPGTTLHTGSPRVPRQCPADPARPVAAGPLRRGTAGHRTRRRNRPVSGPERNGWWFRSPCWHAGEQMGDRSEPNSRSRTRTGQV